MRIKTHGLRHNDLYCKFTLYSCFMLQLVLNDANIRHKRSKEKESHIHKFSCNIILHNGQYILHVSQYDLVPSHM